MKSFKNIFLSFLFLYSLNGLSQIPNSYIKTNVLTNFDFYNGSYFTIEYEKKFKYDFINFTHYKFALNTQIGFYYPFNKLNYIFYKNKGVFFKEELKFYKPENKYFSFSVSYSIGNYNQYLTKSNLNSSYKTKRQFFGIDFNIGKIKRIKENFIIELYTGVGTRLNVIETDLSETELKNRNYGDWTVPHNWIQKSGLNIIPKFNLGIKIGWISGGSFIDI